MMITDLDPKFLTQFQELERNCKEKRTNEDMGRLHR